MLNICRIEMETDGCLLENESMLSLKTLLIAL